jgi:signal transduction histidine kinase
VETTICHEIRQTGHPVIIDHVALDESFRNHHTPAMYGFQSYISVPIIRKDGTFFGTLCAIDPQPHVLETPEITGMFTLFADLISFHLNAIGQWQDSEAQLIEERKIAALRDQFIAILGHDLLNPVGATLNAAQLLLRMNDDERVKKMAAIIQNSSQRMKALIENILDFARGRMGEGITLVLKPDDQLDKALNHVITELTLIWPVITIDAHIDLQGIVYCDSKRIAQLFSNLLGNALTHGKKDAPVKITATNYDGEFILTVANKGSKIPEATMERLFQPFSRGEVKPGQQGLGLGLYISSEIAKAHGGNLEVSSTDEETIFTLQIPSN